MREPERAPQGDRLRPLDGVRGAAALTVVIGHALMAVSHGDDAFAWLQRTPLVAVLNLRLAVEAFFVLSGFVLASSLARNRHASELPQYAVRRVFRIHVPYAFAVLFSWAAAFLYGPLRPEVGPIFQHFAKVHLTGAELARSLAFPGTAFHQVPVGWTLEIEMIFSLLLPLLLWLARRTHWAVLLAVCALPLAWGPYGHPVLKYALDFGIGIAIFLERERVARALARIGAPAAALVLAAGLACAALPRWLGWPLRFDGSSPAEILLQAVGATALVALGGFHPFVRRFFASRACVYLGRISYSLYLLHVPVLLVLASLPVGAGDAWVPVAALAVVIPLSDLTYRIVERPAVVAGNRLCARIARRTGARVVTSNLPGEAAG
jgi:peptidoglycan/LPS O-acetylase OafA/YrhL